MKDSRDVMVFTFVLLGVCGEREKSVLQIETGWLFLMFWGVFHKRKGLNFFYERMEESNERGNVVAFFFRLMDPGACFGGCYDISFIITRTAPPKKDQL